MTRDRSDSGNRTPNRLIGSASPYLRQHAYNPVDWYAWGDDAIRKARTEDKPILLSIGYSACHWCHAMARESFENPQIAGLMNEHFVNIKVDREERPDLDELYMRAAQVMTGRGGWPLTLFLTPNLVPFYAGTYFPPEDEAGLPGFPRVLMSVHEAYTTRRHEVEAGAQRIVEAMRESSAPTRSDQALSSELTEFALRFFSAHFDLEMAGFGPEPKFPQAPVLDFLLRAWAETADARAQLMLTASLERMATGGICDQLGGGFHRYATDRKWLVPHFEKMLYDNAQLLAVYADAYRALRRPGYLDAAEAAARYLLTEMLGPEGAFYSSQAADSEGVEGACYAWTYREIVDCLGKDDGPVAARYYGVTKDGNWEDGRNVLYQSLSVAELSRLFGRDEKDAEDLIARCRLALLAARRQRAAPETDRKLLTDWNALAVSGFVSLHRATGDPGHLATAERCLRFVLEAGRDTQAATSAPPRLTHVWHEGRAQGIAFLSDYALSAAAALDLYESTFDTAWLDAAEGLTSVMVDEYWDAGTGLFAETGRRNEPLFAPLRSMSDQPTPSGCASACHVLLRLARLTGEPSYAPMARSVLENSVAVILQSPQATAHMLAALLRYLSPPRELVIVGLERAGAADMRKVADEFYVPHLVRSGATWGQLGALAARIPLLEGKGPANGSVGYLCSAGACQEPARTPEELRKQLAELVRTAAEQTAGT